ncbi:MAG: potassium transporter TrkH, partial [Butyrivibrio sp.]|nr:potassium transporter TrkH [Butyrivibrio sp.]
MKKRLFTSVQMIPISFFVAIMVGALFLMLPFSSASGKWTPFVDALFSAATSICVTGLTVCDTGTYWSLFGQIVILILIQLGGLGIITVASMFMLTTQKKFTLADRMMVADALNLGKTTGVLRFMISLFKGTFAVELFGALVYATVFIPKYGVARGIWVSIFNAVSAFCNAGMDIMCCDSMVGVRDNPLVMGVTMALIIMGGLGYVVWFDFCDKLKNGVIKKFSPVQIFKRFNEHTKLVICLTLFLLFAGTIIIFAAEFNNPKTIGKMGILDKLANSFFESVTFRTAGFYSFPQESMTDISCIAAYILMFIGGSPIGTAGGV